MATSRNLAWKWENYDSVSFETNFNTADYPDNATLAGFDLEWQTVLRS